MKMNFTIKSLFAMLMLICVANSYSQQRTCGVDEYMEEMLKNPELAKKYEENQKKFQAELARRANGDYSARGASIVIPVAVHFPTGNEADRDCLVALAQSQVDVLNADYTAMNADISNWTAASPFYPGLQPGVANISFCLAVSDHPVGVDPELLEGEPAVTIGYNFANGSGFPELDSNWAGYMNFLIKPLDGTTLGYSPLGGSIENGGAVVMNLSTFGTGSGCPGSGIVPGAPFNLGRTVTHELGHFYNLNHTFADLTCTGDDGLADTPNIDTESYNCPPAGSVNACTPGQYSLTMNYMDYVNDACMYMFTPDQMNVVDAYVSSVLASQIKPGVCEPATPGFNLATTDNEIFSCPNTDTEAVFTFNYSTILDFNETTTFSASGVPAGASVAFSPTSLNSNGSFTMTIGNLGMTAQGDYTITVTGTSSSVTKSFDVVLNNNCTEIQCNTYESAPNLNLTITDGAGGSAGQPILEHVINIPDSGLIESMTVNVNVSHTYVSDVRAVLLHPNQTDFIYLWNLNCGNNDDFDVTFDDEASAITCGSPTVGTFQPAQALSAFSGLESQGDWTLIMLDYFAGDEGTLNNWSIEICSEQQLSVDEFSANEFSIFPNPNNGEFTIKLNSNSGNDIAVDVFDIRGRKIFNNSYSRNNSDFSQSIKLNSVEAGMYLVTVSDGAKKITKKIIVE